MPSASVQDLRYALRTLRSSPGFAATAAVTMALGIGASTAIYSVTNAVLLRPLPYRQPERLVLAWRDSAKRAVRGLPFTNGDFLELRDATTSAFEDMGAVFTFRVIVPREDGRPERIYKAQVTTSFFRMMGARVAHGRDFADADGQPQATQPRAGLPVGSVAILSHEYWQRRYGGNTAAIGREMLAAGQRGPRIVGVLEPGFQLFFPAGGGIEAKPDVWIANDLGYDRSVAALRVIGRLKEGVSLERAQTQVESVAAQLQRNTPGSATSRWSVRLEPMRKHLVAEVRPALLALTGAGIFLLLIASANVANLLLVRGSLREKELAVRQALGGSRWRLMRALLAETVVLAGLGTAVAVGLAWLGVRALLVVAPANLPRLESVAIDGRVLAFAVLAGLAAAGVSGALPAWRAARPRLMEVLHGGGRTAGLRSGRWLRNGVVIAEVALSLVLLVGSGLMLRSFLQLQRIDPGYEARGVLTFLLVGDWRGSEPQRTSFLREIQGRLRALPGVENVTASALFPLTRAFPSISWGLEEAGASAAKFQTADFQTVLPDYFETLRTPLREGRTFREEDNAPGRKRVVIDEFLAAKAFPSQSAAGKRILIMLFGKAVPVEVIGVVGHQRVVSLAEPGREQIYLADGFMGFGVGRNWAIRTSGDPARLAPAVRAALDQFYPQLLVSEMQPMEALLERAQAKTRFSLLLIGVFASVAALLASVGLYGVLATVVRQRTAEIGVRMALGAAPASIFQLVVGHGLRLSAAGIAIGLLAALGLTRALRSLLVGIAPTDALTFASVAGVFLLLAALASWLPARRAARVDPLVALRHE